MGKFDGVLSNGTDFDMSKICSCDKKISECEKECARYYSCDNVAMADDVLKEYEECIDEVERDVKRVLLLAVSDDYIDQILDSIKDDVVEDIVLSSGFSDTVMSYSEDDIRMSVGRVLQNRLLK